MSKLIKMYNEFKEKDKNLIYIFRVGIFYNILNEDAQILNDKIGLKLTSLSPEIIKCGFPISSLEKYTKKLDDLKLQYKIIDNLPENTSIIDYANSIEIKSMLNQISKIDMNNTTLKEAFDILYDLQQKIINMPK